MRRTVGAIAIGGGYVKLIEGMDGAMHWVKPIDGL